MWVIWPQELGDLWTISTATVNMMLHALLNLLCLSSPCELDPGMHELVSKNTAGEQPWHPKQHEYGSDLGVCLWNCNELKGQNRQG